MENKTTNWNLQKSVISKKSQCVFKGFFILILLFTSLNTHAEDYYITTTNLNLRTGAGTNYSSILVIEKGDTVKFIETSDEFWVKINFQNKIGYTAKQHLQKIKATNVKSESVPEESNGYLTLLIFLFIVIVIAIILKNKGDKYRYKSTASILSLFFGTYGFQKFYLGEHKKGVFSILFCWTFIPALIGLIDFIKLVIMNGTKFDNLYNWEKSPKTKSIIQKNTPPLLPENNPKVYVEEKKHTYQSKKNHVDNTIIDVKSQDFDTAIEKNIVNSKPNSEPEYWAHSYVYSYNEIKHATKAQKKYYFYFKNKVLVGEFVDIQGYSNYAFILYFDLLNEYQNHKNIELLEKQFKLINEICPKTRSYSLRSLQDELQKRTDSYSVGKLKSLEEPSYQYEHGYSDYNPDLYKLGNQYKDKLGLTKREVRWLNKFYNPSNVFTSIEGCCTAVIKQYIQTLNELKNRKKTDNIETYITTIIKEKLIRKQDYFNLFETDIYLNIFKEVENSVRKVYGHNRKLSNDGLLNYSSRVQNNFEVNLGNDVKEILNEIESEISSPDLTTQIALNTQNVNRWKSEFEVLKSDYKKEEHDKFIEAFIILENANQKNTNIENIFFEASKFIAKYDKVQSLKYYTKHIYYDLKSKKFDNKELTKTVQKSLFKTDEQINDFKKIVSELIQTKDIQTALDKISNFYIPKRRKIQLDQSEIQEVEQKHEGTVDLLNTYLFDGNGELEAEIKDSLKEAIETAIIPPDEKISVFISEIKMEQVQEELVKMIVNNSYEIEQDVVDKYATENGMFKNQLVDSINEVCEKILDGEALIEEDDENYVIEESYYKEIIK